MLARVVWCGVVMMDKSVHALVHAGSVCYFLLVAIKPTLYEYVPEGFPPLRDLAQRLRGPNERTP